MKPLKHTSQNETSSEAVLPSSLDKLELLRKSEKTLLKLQKRARSKFITSQLTRKLIELNSPNKGRYIKSLSCASTITHADGKITSKYCGCRWCMVCNRIRTGRYINTYAPILANWGKSFMVTLTVPNCHAVNLKSTIDLMNKTIRQITDVFRKRRISFRAVRKLEVTYNNERQDFHPHFHFIVEGDEQAVMLVQEWLKRLPKCSDKAQHIAEFDGDLREMFKYITKLFTRDDRGEIKQVDFAALDFILRTLHGRRTFQNYGFKLPEEITEDEPMELDESLSEGELTNDDCVPKTYLWYESGWVNMDDGLILAEYRITDDIKKLLSKTGLDYS